MNAPVLEAKGLTLAVRGRVLLRALDWRVAAGERWCVIGRNAAGKSTLLRALAGLRVPDRSGQVLWLGRPQDAWALQDAATVRAYMPQHAADRFPIGVRRLLALSSVVPGAEAAEDTLAALDAAHLADRLVTELSGGERQRVALAQCAVQGAAAYLLDEPVSYQDPAHQRRVGRWLQTLATQAVVASAHDMNWVAQTATHVLALNGDGGWEAGPMAAMMTAQRLGRVFDCPWREAEGIWVAE